MFNLVDGNGELARDTPGNAFSYSDMRLAKIAVRVLRLHNGTKYRIKKEEA